MATVPVASPQVTSVAVNPQYAQPNDYLSARIEREASNEVQGAGVDAQRASTDVSNIAMQTAIDNNERQAKDLDNQFSDSLRRIGFGDGTAENPGFYQQQGENALAAAPATRAAIAKAQADVLAKATNPAVIKMVTPALNTRMTDALGGVDRYTGDQRMAANNATSDARIGEAGKNAAVLWNDPKALGQQMGIVKQEVADAALRNGWSKDVAEYKTLVAQSGIIRGAINGALSAGSISTAQSILNANKGSVDGAVQLSIAQDIKQAENAQRIQQEHNVVMAEHYQRQAQDKAYGQVASDIMLGNGDATQIATMTRSGQLDPSQGIALFRMQEAATKPDPLSKVSVATTQTLFKGISDGTITTRKEIDDAFSNGTLSRPDHDWLLTQQKNGLTPDGARLNQTQGDFLKMQEPAIITAKGLGGPLEAKETAANYAYTQWVTQQVQATKTAGKDPMKLFDPTPGNADYLGTPGKIAVFKRAYHLDMSDDIGKALLGFGADPNAPVAPPEPSLLSKVGSAITNIPGAIFGSNNELTGFDSLGALSKAVAKGDVKRDWAESYAASKGWIRAKAP